MTVANAKRIVSNAIRFQRCTQDGFSWQAHMMISQQWLDPADVVAAASGRLGSLPGSGRAQLQSRAVVLASKKTVPTTELADTVFVCSRLFLAKRRTQFSRCLVSAEQFRSD
jgi:hypothetical protein